VGPHGAHGAADSKRWLVGLLIGGRGRGEAASRDCSVRGGLARALRHILHELEVKDAKSNRTRDLRSGDALGLQEVAVQRHGRCAGGRGRTGSLQAPRCTPSQPLVSGSRTPFWNIWVLVSSKLALSCKLILRRRRATIEGVIAATQCGAQWVRHCARVARMH